MEEDDQTVNNSYQSYLGEMTALLNKINQKLDLGSFESKKIIAENRKLQRELDLKQEELDIEKKYKNKYKSLFERANEEIIKLGEKPVGEDEE